MVRLPVKYNKWQIHLEEGVWVLFEVIYNKNQKNSTKICLGMFWEVILFILSVQAYSINSNKLLKSSINFLFFTESMGNL
jgi:hypothetical protein